MERIGRVQHVGFFLALTIMCSDALGDGNDPPAGARSNLQLSDLKGAFDKDHVPLQVRIAPWQEADKCGLNCAYMMLRLNGYDVDYAELSQAAGPIPKGGLNLAQVQSLCLRFGLNCDILRGGFEQIRDLNPPAVLHLGEYGVPGHFVCYVNRTKTSDPTYQFADGTTGVIFQCGNSGDSLESGLRLASGYVLVAVRDPADRILKLLCLFLVALVLFLGFDVLRKNARRSGDGERKAVGGGGES